MVDDLVGKSYGKLLVIEIDSNNNKIGTYWICECTCGKPASEWSLSKDVNDINLGWDHDRQLYYSGDPNDYDSRCISCHRKYDEWRSKI